MPDDNDPNREWVIEPPARGEVAFHMTFGEDVELSAEQEAAIIELLRVLESRDPEVVGHSFDCTGIYTSTSNCLDYATCSILNCTPNQFGCGVLNCGSVVNVPAVGRVRWSLGGTFTPFRR